MANPTDRHAVRVLALIPARGGSKGVPGKNLALVGGRSLIARAVDTCRAASTVDEVVVSTDHAGIAAAALEAGARVIARPDDLAGDLATSESVLLQALHLLSDEGTEPEVTVFVQCTSPFIAGDDVDAAVSTVLEGAADVDFAATPTHEFLWRPELGTMRGLNHDPAARLRRQDTGPDYRETGAFYVMRTAGLLEHKHRFFGRIAVQPVSGTTAIEIDTAEDLQMARALALVAEPAGPIDVDAVVTDFDGVHTNDRAWVDESGREAVTVSRSDGMGVARLRRAGVAVLILSTETNPVVSARAAKLGVPVLHGVADKRAALLDWIASEGLDPARVAYVGNDVNDVGALTAVGWPITVPGAHPDVRTVCRVVLTRPGGDGAIRDLSDRVCAAKGI